MTRRRAFPCLAGVWFMLATTTLSSQPPAPPVSSGPPAPVLTLGTAIRAALAAHPRLAEARADASSAASDLAIARSAQLPRLEGQWQTLRATGSAVAGTHFGMDGLPGVGGPPGNRSPGEGVWGATAALVTSMPITGLLRTRREIEASTSRREAAVARLEHAQLQVAARAAAAYLEARAGRAQVRVADAARERALAIDSLTRALARQGLRPGADSARTAADVAAAEIDVARAEQVVAVALARVANAIGADGSVEIDTTAIQLGTIGIVEQVRHPAERVADADMQAAAAQQRVAATAWLPRIDLLGAAFARGSGEPVIGIPSAVPMRGIAPNVGNWAVGVIASWPLTGVPAWRAEQRRAEAEADAAQARALTVHNTLTAERAEAQAALQGAQRIAARTAALVSAANATLEQFLARYRAGLTTHVEVADAQRQLARAEMDDAVAQLEVIAARLRQAQANGDLAQFLKLVDTERGR